MHRGQAGHTALRSPARVSNAHQQIEPAPLTTPTRSPRIGLMPRRLRPGIVAFHSRIRVGSRVLWVQSAFPARFPIHSCTVPGAVAAGLPRKQSLPSFASSEQPKHDLPLWPRHLSEVARIKGRQRKRTRSGDPSPAAAGEHQVPCARAGPVRRPNLADTAEEGALFVNLERRQHQVQRPVGRGLCHDVEDRPVTESLAAGGIELGRGTRVGIGRGEAVPVLVLAVW